MVEGVGLGLPGLEVELDPQLGSTQANTNRMALLFRQPSHLEIISAPFFMEILVSLSERCLSTLGQFSRSGDHSLPDRNRRPPGGPLHHYTRITRCGILSVTISVCAQMILALSSQKLFGAQDPSYLTGSLFFNVSLTPSANAAGNALSNRLSGTCRKSAVARYRVG